MPSPSNRLTADGSRLKWIFAGILVLASTVLYDPGRFENTSGDSISTRYWPVAILKHHTYKLNPFAKDLEGVAFAALYLGNGDWLPRVNFGMGVFTIPFYAIADWTNLGGAEWTHDRINTISRWNAIFLAVWSVLALYLLLVKFVPLETAFISSAFFAFGTWNWSLGAQGLSWQTAAVLMLMWHMHLLWRITTTTDRGKLVQYGVLLGLLHALGWATRPADIFLFVPAVLILWRQRLLFFYSVSAAAVLIPLIQSHLDIYWHWLGFYGMLLKITYGNTHSAFRFTFPEGFLGLLFSPNRGAVVFFPLMLMAPWLWLRLMPALKLKEMLNELKAMKLPHWSNKMHHGVPTSLSNSLFWGLVLYFVSICNLDFWHSTWSYGPRYLYDMQPFLWIPITLALNEVRKWWKLRSTEKRLGKYGKQARGMALPGWSLVVLLALAVQGVGVHWLGHNNYDLWTWNGRGGEVVNARAWDFNDFMLLEVWKRGSNRHRWTDALKRLKEVGY